MSRLSKKLMSMMAIGGLISMELNEELGGDRRRHLKPQEPKRIGYDHKELTPEEKRAKYWHKLKIKERRKRKDCRKGGRI